MRHEGEIVLIVDDRDGQAGGQASLRGAAHGEAQVRDIRVLGTAAQRAVFVDADERGRRFQSRKRNAVQGEALPRVFRRRKLAAQALEQEALPENGICESSIACRPAYLSRCARSSRMSAAVFSTAARISSGMQGFSKYSGYAEFERLLREEAKSS